MPSATSPATSVINWPTAARNTFGGPYGLGGGCEERRHQRVAVELAVELERLPVVPRGPDRVQRQDVLAHTCRRVRPRHREPLLDVRLDLRTESEDEPALRHHAAGRSRCTRAPSACGRTPLRCRCRARSARCARRRAPAARSSRAPSPRSAGRRIRASSSSLARNPTSVADVPITPVSTRMGVTLSSHPLTCHTLAVPSNHDRGGDCTRGP